MAPRMVRPPAAAARGGRTGPALLAIAHGSRDPRHAAALGRLMDAVSAARPDVPVRLGFLDLCGPDVPTAFAELAGQLSTSSASSAAGCPGAVVAVPLFLASGYHVRHDVPRVLREAVAALPGAPSRSPLNQGSPNQDQSPSNQGPSIAVAEPLGGATGHPEPLLLEALDRRLREAGHWTADPRLGVVLASAGSSGLAAQAQLRRAAAAWNSVYGNAAQCAFASAALPTVSDAVAELRARGCADVAVASYFLAPGRLADRVREEAAAVGAASSEPFATAGGGPATELVRLLLRRYTDAAAALRRHSPAA
jgi:sirohydrochlorin ferrochelatase